MTDNSDDDSDGASVGRSDLGSGSQRQSASKDRKCPFCHQQFTSSSLGRHLDTFIRERNPKPPDGIHNVVEIRKLRSTITRRHARVSSARDHTQRREQPSPAPVQRPLPDTNAFTQTSIPQPVQPRAQASHVNTPQLRDVNTEHAHRMNKTHWTATGVINNLPPRSGSSPIGRELPYPVSAQSAYKGPSIQELEDRRKAQATELALKEVLQVIHDAAKQIHKPPIFDFEFFAQNYPALCLRLLTSPASLSSQDPQPSAKAWSLDKPSRTELNEIANILWDRISEYDQQWEQHRESGQGNGVNGSDSRISAEYQKYFRHAERALNEWNNMDEERKTHIYKLELMKAFAEEATRRKQTEQKAEQLQTENAQLKTQLASVHTLGLPYLSQTIIKNLIDREDITNWTFDDLVSKWKSTISQRQSLSYGPPSHTALGQAATPQVAEEMVATPSSSHSHAPRQDADYSGWGLPDGIPRMKSREQNYQTRGALANNASYGNMNADVQMQDVSGSAGSSHVREGNQDAG